MPGEKKSRTGNREQKSSESDGGIPGRGLYLDPITADIDGEIYSATLLQTFNLCPTKYFLRHRLGMSVPESEYRLPETSNKLDEYDDSILSTVKGELIHAVLHALLTEGHDSDAGIFGHRRRL